MLELIEVDVNRGQLPVVHHVTMNIRKGEIVSLLGPNGAGKTTLMHAISGVIPVRKGRVVFEGQDITRAAPAEITEMGLAQVPEGRQLFNKMSVWDNLVTGAYSPRARKGFKKNLEFAFHLFPRLAERQKQHAGSLSGGEQQMVAIGRALMSQPSFLILDEPSLGLAPVIVSRIFSLVGEIRQQGISILLTEQNVYSSLNISDRGYVLNNGEIELQGSGQELLQNTVIKQAYLGL